MEKLFAEVTHGVNFVIWLLALRSCETVLPVTPQHLVGRGGKHLTRHSQCGFFILLKFCEFQTRFLCICLSEVQHVNNFMFEFFFFHV